MGINKILFTDVSCPRIHPQQPRPLRSLWKIPYLRLQLCLTACTRNPLLAAPDKAVYQLRRKYPVPQDGADLKPENGRYVSILTSLSKKVITEPEVRF